MIMEKLNVCLINDSFPPAIDGVANAVVNYGSIIQRGLGSATVVTPFYPDADDSVFDFPVIRYPSIDMTAAVGYRAGLPFSAEVLSELEKKDFDIIHTHCPITSTMLARVLRSRTDKPIVFTYHTKFDIDIANAVKGKLLQDEAARLLVDNIAACDEVWTVSKGAGENLRALGYKGDYYVMPNGVDFPRGRVSDDIIAEAVKDYDLPEGLPVFLFVGRMMWYKGIRISLDALKLLKDSGADFRMVFIGAGGDKDEIVKHSESLGLQEKVIFVPPIHDRTVIRARYCRADLFLFPSTFDTNGLVVREAAACGLGSVLIAGSCAAEDVEDKVNGLLIEENPESMFALLKAVYRDFGLMHTIGENAQRDIYVSWEDSVKRAYERYGVIIERYNSGLTSHQDDFSDDLFQIMGRGLSDVDKLRCRRREFINEMYSEYDELRMDVNEKRSRIKERVEGFRSQLNMEMRESRDRFEENLDELQRLFENTRRRK